MKSSSSVKALHRFIINQFNDINSKDETQEKNNTNLSSSRSNTNSPRNLENIKTYIKPRKLSPSVIKLDNLEIMKKIRRPNLSRELSSPNPLNNDIFFRNNFQNIIEIKDLIGNDANKPISINMLNEFNDFFYKCKISTKSFDKIKSYAANTNHGIIRKNNEDRVSIIINYLPFENDYNFNNKNFKYKKISFFGIFDGHGGSECSEFLRDNLLKIICDNEHFKTDIKLAIKEGFKKADEIYLKKCINNNIIINNNGSCALILLLVDNNIYIANLGDSRCLISLKNGTIQKSVTRDHKPDKDYEKKRIIFNGGKIYQSQTILNLNLIANLDENNNNDENNFEQNCLNNKLLLGPYRVFPGKLSVSRTIGDPEAKLSKFGGNNKVVINEPDIYYYNLDKDDIDYFILGCDGIFDQLSIKDVFDCVNIVVNNNKENYINDKYDENKENYWSNVCGNIVDLILKAAMCRKSLDNVTCIIVSFKDLLEMKKKENMLIKEEINKERKINEYIKIKNCNSFVINKNQNNEKYSKRKVKTARKIFVEYTSKSPENLKIKNEIIKASSPYKYSFHNNFNLSKKNSRNKSPVFSNRNKKIQLSKGNSPKKMNKQLVLNTSQDEKKSKIFNNSNKGSKILTIKTNTSLNNNSNEYSSNYKERINKAKTKINDYKNYLYYKKSHKKSNVFNNSKSNSSSKHMKKIRQKFYNDSYNSDKYKNLKKIFIGCTKIMKNKSCFFEKNKKYSTNKSETKVNLKQNFFQQSNYAKCCPVNIKTAFISLDLSANSGKIILDTHK